MSRRFRFALSIAVALVCGCTSSGGSRSSSSSGGSDAPPPSEHATGRSSGPASGGGGSRGGGGGGQITLDGALIQSAVSDFCQQVSKLYARGWPAHAILDAEGKPSARIETSDQRGGGTADATALAGRLEDGLVSQGVLTVVRGGARPKDDSDREYSEAMMGKEVDPVREDTTAFAVQGEISPGEKGPAIEVRLFDLARNKILARTLVQSR